MKKTMFELLNDSHTSGGHLTYLENLYEQFLASPDSVADDWKNFFSELREGSTEVNHSKIIESFREKKRARHSEKTSPASKVKDLQSDIANLAIKTFRDFGHTEANLDPLGIAEKVPHS